MLHQRTTTQRRLSIFSFFLAGTITVLAASLTLASDALDLSQATLVIRPGDLPPAEQAAATILTEELAARTRIHLNTTSKWPSDKTRIVITSQKKVPTWNIEIPSLNQANKPDGYRLYVDDNIVWILGNDPRGTLYGVGALLRHLDWNNGKASLPAKLDITTSPAYPIRGHQLGFRPQANSWDAWIPAQFDQYIRELALFGVNSIENIPFQDNRTTPVMKVTRQEMNVKMSAICARYGLDYWIWTPADYDLADPAARTKALEDHEKLYHDCQELTGVFFPGGDPGENPPELVLPFLEEIADRLLPIHPDARIWLSLQWFNQEQIKFIIKYVERESPDWLGGLVAGPSAPPIPITREILPEKYKYRLYPDITHNKLCQYPVPWWDQAFALTLGRESINPRPVHYAYIHNWFAPYSDGFISYSDGVHDDVNKTIWSSLSWDPSADPRDVLVQYCRVFFHPQVAESAADGIFSLENNWNGSLRDHGSVDGTLLYWQELEKQMPELEDNWRWQMCLVRAYYDAYTRHRLLNESHLETEANAILARCELLGAEKAMAQATAVLNRVVQKPIDTKLRLRIFDLCEKLYQSCGLQTSVSKYHASGGERGAFLDYIDYPLNNRWWLEDKFKKVHKLPTEAERCRQLLRIAHWEAPPTGSFYDDVGNPAQSPHVEGNESYVTRPGEEAYPLPTHWWWDEGMSRERLSWQTTMNYPESLVYEGLDPNASYKVRMSGYGKFLLRIDGHRIGDTDSRVEMGEVQEVIVPKEHLQDRKLVLTWDSPTDEDHLNWRLHSRLAEVWLLKQ